MSDAQGIGIVVSCVGTVFALLFAIDWWVHGLREALATFGIVLGFMAILAAFIVFWFWVWGAFA